MSILESKINSVDYVANVQTSAGMTADLPSVNTQPVPAQPAAAPVPAPATPQPGVPQMQAAPVEQPPAEVVEEAPAPAAAGPKFYRYDQHPEYKHYFLLLRLGVSKDTIIQKIKVEGKVFDVGVLDQEPEELTDTPIPDEDEDEE
eukprot:TRINITY_DN3160_c0_g1_i1.p1 TRINITY_DN3160_c0_g1~~TRINITY_DN3160_c0_g1_i1.p1  ORF type:complete len:145 (-),score=41.03 TRINITY_DN3160_c0_g1_i1:286-720(-)